MRTWPVPSVTVCDTPFEWHLYDFIFGLPRNSTVSQKLWRTSEPLHKVIYTCEPACRPQESVPYPGGRVEVGIGSWESWPSLSESTLCHTLTPNVTWSQLAQAAGQKRFELEMWVGDKRPNCDHRLFVHPHRRPVMSSPGVRGVQQDLRVRSLCHDEVTSDLVSVKLISRIIDRESLNRAPCNPAKDYYYESCIMDCAHRQWADRKNCSTPEMIRDYPQLPECSRAVLRRAQRDGSLAVNTTNCTCLPACRIRSFVADTGVEMFPKPNSWSSNKLLVARVAAASVAEEVTTERRSYRLPSLLSEMGGFVSLVLGVSVLSVVDMVTEAIARRTSIQTNEPKENCSWSDSDAQSRISIISYRYCYPTISGVGIVGSLLLLLVLRDARFGGAGVYTYLRCLMLSDSVALTVGAASLLVESWDPTVFCAGRPVKMRSHSGAVWYSVAMPLTNALVGFSMGVTLWMTYDRYQAVRVPHELWRQRRPERRCGGRPLRIAATLLVSLALHMPQTLGFRVVHHCPAGLPEFYELLLTDFASDSWVWCSYQWSLQLLVRWLPAGIVLYCNSYIIFAIKRRERRKSAADAAAASCSHVDVERVSDRLGSSAARLSWLAPEGRSSQAGLTAAGGPDERSRRRRRRQETENRLELLLVAMAVSCLVTNCLQSVAIILDMVYEDDGIDFEILRSVGNNAEALNVSLDFVFAMAFVKQIREAFMCQLRHAGEAVRWLIMVP
ncbi:Acid-sensing ion channel 1 [Amphibalanus amphitrite]|uniref:Acid-sensing ion channel 1 n=1 Tax=Amphibalanus amphitrite TaxID=1232801 RepID=A0A6A4V1I4_AMPAM|nr:Acid-sensing ion channel 1 [Amphibalanus amphitrite]